MDVLKSLALAFSCFTRLPVPKVDWDPKNMRFMLACLPVVGIVVGCIVAAWCLIADAVAFGPALKAAGIALLPLAVTGGFHLDGFSDVVDAQSSHAAPAKKREIMKDPHIGSFAAIAIAAYLIAYFAIATEVPAGCCPHPVPACHVALRFGFRLVGVLGQRLGWHADVVPR